MLVEGFRGRKTQLGQGLRCQGHRENSLAAEPAGWQEVLRSSAVSPGKRLRESRAETLGAWQEAESKAHDRAR